MGRPRADDGDPIVVVIIGARIDGAKGITGSPQAGPVPQPPTVGECLLERTGEFGGWGFGGPLYPALRLAPCTGDRWGEVVSVLPDALTSPTSAITTDGGGALVTEMPNQSLCDRERSTYLGADAALQGRWDLLVGGMAAVGPSSLQRTAGQAWVACVIKPGDGHAATPMRYRGSVRNVLDNGVLPVAFATCSATADVARIVPESCDRPHRVEVFGVVATVSGDTQVGLDASCLKLVRWLMRNSDPTKDGLLAVRAFTTHIDRSGAAVEGLGPNSDATCIVEPTAHGNVLGSLFGLGLNPIPWA